MRGHLAFAPPAVSINIEDAYGMQQRITRQRYMRCMHTTWGRSRTIPEQLMKHVTKLLALLKIVKVCLHHVLDVFCTGYTNAIQ